LLAVIYMHLARGQSKETSTPQEGEYYVHTQSQLTTLRCNTGPGYRPASPTHTCPQRKHKRTVKTVTSLQGIRMPAYPITDDCPKWRATGPDGDDGGYSLKGVNVK
jgi:hypothetical protein